MTYSENAIGLRIGAMLIFGFGLLTVIAAVPPLDQPILWLVDLAVLPDLVAISAGEPLTRLLFAVIGGIVIGWAALVWGLSGAPYRAAPAEIRRVVVMSYGVWFAVDSLFSVLAGAAMNVIGNFAFLLLLVIPLLRQGQPAATDSER